MASPPSRADALPPAVRSLYPWSGRLVQVAGGHALFTLDEGEGEPLLMLHGNPTWSFYYRNLVRAFSGQYRCVVPDHLGCGLSDKPQDWTYCLEAHTQNVLTLIDTLGLERITLVAHDWGGAIGLYAALLNRSRFRRIVLFNTMSQMNHLPLSIRLSRVPGLGPVVLRGLNGFLRYAVRYATAQPGGLQGAVKQGYLAPYNSWANRIAIQRFVEDIPLEANHPTKPIQHRMEREIPSLGDLPALILWGNQDVVFHHGFRDAWKETWPNAEFHAFDHAHHFVVEDALDDITPLMQGFLERHPITPESA